MKTYNTALPNVGLSFIFIGDIFKSSIYYRLLTTFFIFNSLISFAGEIKNKSAKVHNNTNYAAVKKASASPLTGAESLRTNLYLLNANNSTILADGVLIEYNNLYHDSVYLEDAYKFTNINENLGLTRYGSVLAIERRPIISITDTLFFKLWKTTMRNYQFAFEMVNLDHPGMEAFLEDSYLGTSTQLTLNGITKINFSVNIDAASSNANRFRIVFKTAIAMAVPLPVTFTSVKSYQLGNKILLEWKVENEINIKEYDIERSVNGNDFNKLNSISIKGQTSASGSYSSIDENPPKGNIFYRIKSIDRDNIPKYSQIIRVSKVKADAGNIITYPNPVTDNRVNLQFTNQATGIYQVKMINGQGQIVLSSKLTVSSGNMSKSIFSNRKLGSGIYLLEIKSPDNTIQINKIIVR